MSHSAHIYLLTHSRELQKASNTGKLVTEVLQHSASTLLWDRKNPDQNLLERIKDNNIALLYPNDDSEYLDENSSFDGYIVIDGTWQEARKMYNHSPYLHALPTIKLKPSIPSRFTLRRNQLENGLCTAECVIALLQAEGEKETATKLEQRFDEFLAQHTKR